MTTLPFESHIEQFLEQGRMVGISVAVLEGSDVKFCKSFGRTSTEDHAVPVTADTLFAYGSMSKTLCAALILRLVEEKRLDLDRPIVDYLPDSPFQDGVRGRKVTLRHLLSHSSGLPAGGRYWGLRGRDALKVSMEKEVVLYEFVADPGDVFIYANTAFCLAGYVAEVVTHHHYDDLLQLYIFDPLEMTSCTFDLAVAATYPLALPHQHSDTGELKVLHRLTDNDMGHPSSFCMGSTADLATFVGALLTPGKLLTQESLEAMRTMQVSRHIEGASHPWAHLFAGYGLGLMVGSYRGIPVVQHGGTNLSYGGYLHLIPDHKLGIVIQSNFDDGAVSDVLFSIYDYYFEPREPLYPAAPLTIDEPDVDMSACGDYVSEQLGLVRLSCGQNGLMLERNDKKFPLNLIGENRYYYEQTFGDTTLRIPVAIVKKVASTYLIIGGMPYQPVTLPADDSNSEDWISFAGVYIDPFTPYPDETAIEVSVDRNPVTIDGLAGTALSVSKFATSSGVYEFLREADQMVLIVGQATRYRLEGVIS